MAGKTKKKLSTKFRLRLILLVILLFAVCVVWVLNFTGIITYGDILVKLGFKQKPALDPDTTVHFIDVGQGDCTLLLSNGRAMLIDSGDRDESDKVIGYLRNMGVQRLDYIIVTHPHADHMGEMADIIHEFPVGDVIMPEIPDKLVPTTKSYEKMLFAVQDKGIGLTKAYRGSFTVGDCEVQLYPSAVEDTDDLNDMSVVVRIVHGKNRFLITGDCSKDEEMSLIEKKYDLSANVLKVGHHGSSKSSTAEFLDRVMPKYAVISCGRDNDYGHPHEITVTRLSKYADEIYITAEVGTIVFASDGEGLNIETKKAS